MAHIIEVAKSARSSCRTCGERIEKEVLRLGEEVPNPFDPDGGTTHRWHHLPCAAKARPHALRDALSATTLDIPDRAALDAALVEGLATARPPFPYAEHASTGRARCQACRETLEKGALRVAYARDPETNPDAAAYLHPACAPAHLKDPDVLRKVLAHSRGLADADTAALKTAMQPAAAP